LLFRPGKEKGIDFKAVIGPADGQKKKRWKQRSIAKGDQREGVGTGRAERRGCRAKAI